MRNGSFIVTMAMVAVMTVPFAWAEKPHGEAKEQGKGYGEHGGGMKGRHGGGGHFLRHLLMHQKEIGLSEEQVGKIQALQLELDKTRIRTEAEIQVAERELHALIKDEKAELAAIEAKLKQGADLEVSLRLAAVKTRRDAMALLTPEQREKEKAEHDKMMKMRSEHRKGEKNGMEHGMGQGMKPGAEHSGPMH
ncbi:MAG TPA: periplasmic heavy metal sensor [Nitrospiraceae bacterium]|jgi:Spy/CpxP family protein refolding chaperone